jgi:hypothetical protein
LLVFCSWLMQNHKHSDKRAFHEGITCINHWHIQDMFIAREDGPELLSDKFNTDELFSCG